MLSPSQPNVSEYHKKTAYGNIQSGPFQQQMIEVSVSLRRKGESLKCPERGKFSFRHGWIQGLSNDAFKTP